MPKKPAIMGTGMMDMGMGMATGTKCLPVPVPTIPLSVYLPGISYPCRTLLIGYIRFCRLHHSRPTS